MKEHLLDIGIAWAVYYRVIERLCVIRPCNLFDFLTPENIIATSWDVQLEDMSGPSDLTFMPPPAMPKDTF